MNEDDTYPKPPHGWTCFHCGETFTTTGSARDHFGADTRSKPGCLLKVQLGPERGLLMALRKAENECKIAWAALHQETTDVHRAMQALRSRHMDALLQAEEAGYARGFADGKTAKV